jgi:uncharacterized protein (TIGR02646 family)
MRALSYPSEPTELVEARTRFHPGSDSTDEAWSQFGTDGGKAPIRETLWQMSGERCAYCEGLLDDEGHIEHFRRKRVHSALTFVWDNLLPSCGSQNHCGHYKDRRGAPPYKIKDLIHPGLEDPELLLTFASDGKVYPRVPATHPNHNRATETIRILGLDNEGLRRRRENMIKSFSPLLNDPSFTIQDLIALLPGACHETAIRHALGAR